MTSDVLADANVLVYCYDRTEPQKRRRARDLLDRVLATGRGILSTQVLGEFFRTVTKKLADPLTPRDALTQVENLSRSWPVVPITVPIALEAGRGVRDHGFSYWDAQLWATARLNQVPTILSEDFTDGRIVEAVEFVSPFGARLARFGL
ncbi:MAG: PIN domain-containing protein [Planctomycetales bacterium]|nr:PIN domain-containing protein [Planctomycetales bacterium]